VTALPEASGCRPVLGAKVERSGLGGPGRRGLPFDCAACHVGSTCRLPWVTTPSRPSGRRAGLHSVADDRVCVCDGSLLRDSESEAAGRLLSKLLLSSAIYTDDSESEARESLPA
jgi:hypothetical protein